ncbi:MAG: site-specific DNA-methyltransferase [Xanthomonadales bacterium]|nr:site-specific DNA-methyltransferase [Xanthomonadales bacterium]
MSRVETIGRATLYLGDCAAILPTLAPVDLVCTDPPYGIKVAPQGKIGNENLAAAKDYGKQEWDNQPISTELYQAVRQSGQWQIIFGGNYYDCPAASCWLVWDKVNGESTFADCELAWTNLPKPVRLIRYMWNGMLREKGAQRGDHPTQKPLEVMKWCIGQAPASETVIDPFMGSGTTGVAAIQMGKAFIGIEREERYFEAACRRIREANGDDLGPLFIEGAAA